MERCGLSEEETHRAVEASRHGWVSAVRFIAGKTPPAPTAEPKSSRDACSAAVLGLVHSLTRQSWTGPVSPATSSCLSQSIPLTQLPSQSIFLYQK
jgi:hypothetical protein